MVVSAGKVLGTEVRHMFVTRENAPRLLSGAHVPNEFDVLSIDVDDVRALYARRQELRLTFDLLPRSSVDDLADLAQAALTRALTDRLGFIASKDGYADIDFKGVLPDESGFANISLGLKYAVFWDPAADAILKEVRPGNAAVPAQKVPAPATAK